MEDSKYTLAFVVPAFSIYLIFFILPCIAQIFVAFTDWSLDFFNNPQFNGIDNFKMMFTDPVFFKALTNTIYYTVVTTVLKVSLGLAFAVILNRKLKFTNIYRAIIFSPIMVSTVVVALIFNAIYHPERGLLNLFLRGIGLGALAKPWLLDVKYAMNAACVMDIWIGTGMLMAIFLAGIQAIPKDYYEAAVIDGANEFKKFFKITLPLIFSSLTVNTALGLIAGLKVFGSIFALTNGGPNDATQVVGTFLFRYFGQGMIGYTAAVGLVFTIFISLVSFFQIGWMRKKEVEL
ncbi:carbohydrate ABC transporter membrane protein 1 (CUT1 family) [Anaerobacterium chartisolvens]|uniref:Carbohydrate ABC transporter membrane protein 1 (CUT1 family) n=1 Tax=Anaerobacterium chartisolvens TaxID=1297424 RepID=A0A369BBZ1_9FIRM|nr:sugar ABC transporter permease [Anaerobacterium chartisolvens]RCX18865.1 carbohydrate ABC transporter membrane protein 1 (CUT1 family) [Anaerobacterium chartisolvens]